MSIEKQGIIVGISGSGTTMQAVYEATQDGRLPKTEIVAVFSTNPDAGGLALAWEFKTLDNFEDLSVLDATSPEYGQNIIDKIFEPRKNRFDIFCQYGLEPMTPKIVLDWLAANGKSGINQHGGAVNPDSYDFGGYGMSCAERFNAARMMFVRETGRDFYQYPVAQRIGENYDEGKVYRREMTTIFDEYWVSDLTRVNKSREWDLQIDTLKDFEIGEVMTQEPIPDLVREEERPLLQMVKNIARKLYDKDGNEILNPNFDNLANDRFSIYDIRRLVGSLYPKR